MYILLLSSIIIILVIFLFIISVYLYKCSKDCENCNNPCEPCDNTTNKQRIEKIKKKYPTDKIMGGWIYPSTYGAKGWNPDNFGYLTYINVGSVRLKSDNGSLSVDDEKVSSSETKKLLEDIRKNGIKILLSFDIEENPGKTDLWEDILSDKNNVSKVSKVIIDVLDKYNVDGVNIDWEPLVKPTDEVKNNVTSLFKAIKSVTLKSGKIPLICIDAMKDTYNLKDINDYIDYFEIMSYFVLNLPYDYETYYSDIDKSKIIVGIGLSAYSYSGVPVGKNPNCPAMNIVNNDWGVYCGDNNDQVCKTEGVYPSWNDVDPNKQYKYDLYLKKIKDGEGKYIYSDGFKYPGITGELSHMSYLYFKENNSLLPFNGLNNIEKWAKLVLDQGYGGIFTWITTADSEEGIFTEKIYEHLAIYPYFNCIGQ